MLCKAPTRSCSWITDDKCLPIIRAVNDVTNPKVESLTRGDQNIMILRTELKGLCFQWTIMELSL